MSHKGKVVGMARLIASFTEKTRRLVRTYTGLALFMAWAYCAFYSCVLVQTPYTIRESERYWALAMLVAAGVAALLHALLRRGTHVGGMRCWALAAGALAAVATIFIYASFETAPYNRTFTHLGGILAGCALPFLLLLWGQTLSARPEDDVEFCVPMAFLIALALYMPVVAAKNTFSAVVVALCPLASVLLALHVTFSAPKDASVTSGLFGRPGALNGNMSTLPSPRGFTAPLRAEAPLWKTAVLFALLWFSFAFFRSLVSPTYFTDRFDHYLLPFACAGVMALGVMVASVFRAREVGLFTTYRWVLPFLCAGYALLFVRDETVGKLAFTFCFVGLAALQLGALTSVCKTCWRRGMAVERMALPLLMGMGVGVAAGTACGLWELGQTQADAWEGAVLFIPIAAVTVVLAWGCDARDLMPAKPVAGAQGVRRVVGTIGCSPASIDGIAVAQANELARRCGLSDREREVLGYLLAGRSRPYIRDALHLSLNTVNTHARNAYAKLGVHSQQELITLARMEPAGNRRHAAEG